MAHHSDGKHKKYPIDHHHSRKHKHAGHHATGHKHGHKKGHAGKGGKVSVSGGVIKGGSYIDG